MWSSLGIYSLGARLVFCSYAKARTSVWDRLQGISFRSLTRIIPEKVSARGSPNTQKELSLTANAFARQRHTDETLFAALVQVVEWQLSDFNEQELVNTSWALLQPALFGLLGAAVGCVRS